MTTIRENWNTALALLAAAFLVAMGVAVLGASDVETGERAAITVMTGVGGAALLGGLWGLRSGRFPVWTSHVLVAVGLVPVAMFFWLVLPVLLAAVVLVSGVVGQGLRRELAGA